MRNIIHVNQHIIKANRLTGANDPPLTIKNYKGNTKAHAVYINGPSKVVHSPDKPLACGAKVWIETTAPLVIHQYPEDT